MNRCRAVESEGIGRKHASSLLFGGGRRNSISKIVVRASREAVIKARIARVCAPADGVRTALSPMVEIRAVLPIARPDYPVADGRGLIPAAASGQ